MTKKMLLLEKILLYQSKLKNFVDSKLPEWTISALISDYIFPKNILPQDLYEMTLGLGLLLTLFLAMKLRKNPKYLCILALTTPLVIILFPVIIFITKVM